MGIHYSSKLLRPIQNLEIPPNRFTAAKEAKPPHGNSLFRQAIEAHTESGNTTQPIYYSKRGEASYQPRVFMILCSFSSVFFSTRTIFLAWAFLIFSVRASISAGFSIKSMAPSFMAWIPFSRVA